MTTRITVNHQQPDSDKQLRVILEDFDFTTQKFKEVAQVVIAPGGSHEFYLHQQRRLGAVTEEPHNGEQKTASPR